MMLFYDIIITFGQEVEQIWMRKFSIMSVLFLLVRSSSCLDDTISREILTQEPLYLAVGVYCNHRVCRLNIR